MSEENTIPKTSEERESRKRILACAKSEFAERGFEGARMAEIAHKAQVNKALIHYYYKSKELLYFEVIKNIFGYTDIEIPIPVPEYSGKLALTPSQKLYVVLYFMANSHLKGADPETIKLFFWEIAEGEKYLNYFMEKYTAPRHIKLLNIIREGVAAGEFETEIPELSVAAIFSFITFYTIDIKLSGGQHKYFFETEILDYNEVVRFMIVNAFKSLRPSGKPFKLPEVPADFMTYVDTLLDILIANKNEGIMGQIIGRVEEMIL